MSSPQPTHQARFLSGAAGTPPTMTVGVWRIDQNPDHDEPLATAAIPITDTGASDAALIAQALVVLDAQLLELDQKTAGDALNAALAQRAAAFIGRSVPFVHPLAAPAS